MGKSSKELLQIPTAARPTPGQGLAVGLDGRVATSVLPRVIAGRITSGGAITSGTGFTVSKGATGVYTITYTLPFTTAPVVVVGVEGGGVVGGPSTNGAASVVVSIVDAGNVVAGSAQPRDQAFGFVATEIR